MYVKIKDVSVLRTFYTLYITQCSSCPDIPKSECHNNGYRQANVAQDQNVPETTEVETAALSDVTNFTKDVVNEE